MKILAQGDLAGKKGARPALWGTWTVPRSALLGCCYAWFPLLPVCGFHGTGTVPRPPLGPPPTRRFRGPPWSSAEWRGGSLRTCVTSPCPLPSGRGSGGHTLLPLLLLCLPQIATTSFSAGYSGSSFPKRPQFFPSESPGSPKALFWRGEPNGTGTLRTSLASSLMGVKKNPDPTSPHP